MSLRESPASMLRRHGLRPKHSWGQNFLGDENVLAQIAGVLHLNRDDVVVELGAGLGHFTRALLDTPAKKVVAVERDRELVHVLKEELAEEKRAEVFEGNATAINFAQVAQTPRVVVCGNLPYHLTSSILFAVLEQRTSVSRAAFTLQKEVVERLAAEPGSRAYGILSVLLSLYFEVEQVLTLRAALFHPPPDVDSAVVSLEALPKPRAEVTSDERFIRVVKAGFAQRRKTLLNSLKSDKSLEDPAGALARAGIDPSRRAETLSATEFASLERAFSV